MQTLPVMGRTRPLLLAAGLMCAAQGAAQDNRLESIVITAERRQSAPRDLAASIFVTAGARF